MISKCTSKNCVQVVNEPVGKWSERKTSSKQVLTKTGPYEVIRTAWMRLPNSRGGHQKWVVDSCNPATLNIFFGASQKYSQHKNFISHWDRASDTRLLNQTSNSKKMTQMLTRAWLKSLKILRSLTFPLYLTWREAGVSGENKHRRCNSFNYYYHQFCVLCGSFKGKHTPLCLTFKFEKQNQKIWPSWKWTCVTGCAAQINATGRVWCALEREGRGRALTVSGSDRSRDNWPTLACLFRTRR